MSPPSAKPPSGAQFEISFDEQRAIVTEVGATLRAYSQGKRQIIDGFAPDEICSGGRGQVLAPWPNRVRDGAYEFRGKRLQLALSEPERQNAIHGLVRWVSWQPLEHTPERVRLGLTIHPQPGYPFSIEMSVAYSLGDAGLLISAAARNVGGEPAPFGFGQHPYLCSAEGLIDGARLRIPAVEVLELDDRLIPTGRREPVAGTAVDYRVERLLGTTILDACFAGFQEPYVEFDGVRLWWDAAHTFIQVFSGDTLSPQRRRRGLAVEPMSCPPDGFNSGNGLVVLEPGDEWAGSWGISTAGL